jgi:hypothetical protein
MKKSIFILCFIFFNYTVSKACDKCGTYNNSDFKIKSATITHKADLGITVWDIKVEGTAGKTMPKPVGQLNGAPVLAYVFPTTLKSSDIGFGQAEGIVALALTSHPDFEDTPLWDENLDGNYLNDGLVWHAHWVLLIEDKRVAGGLSVREFTKGDPNVILPPTNPGMAMYMDSPGFNIVSKGNSIKVIVPNFRINNKTNFNFDAVSCYMEVSTGAGGSHEGEGTKPMLGVYKVYTVASGNLSLPYSVK